MTPPGALTRTVVPPRTLPSAAAPPGDLLGVVAPLGTLPGEVAPPGDLPVVMAILGALTRIAEPPSDRTFQGQERLQGSSMGGSASSSPPRGCGSPRDPSNASAPLGAFPNEEASQQALTWAVLTSAKITVPRVFSRSYDVPKHLLMGGGTPRGPPRGCGSPRSPSKALAPPGVLPDEEVPLQVFTEV
ncbi:uncharacterized protein LOC121864980 [Homarus americanus]|uniref:uncharacterized protein LOC121864980 n=1 Tax=Homarus americanus TaxID=6706 RepID=UPI001C459883|nr:uncharacterized protein LOC121864980 [Homarus americanus]